jgi:hypothetical protein
MIILLTVTIIANVPLIDATVKKAALTIKLSVMTIVPAPMILAILQLVVFTLVYLVMIPTPALMILVVLFRDVYTQRRFVMTTISVPQIPAMLILEFVIMYQQTVMIIITVPPKHVNYQLENVYITVLIAMITTHVPAIDVIKILVVVMMQFLAHLPLV